MRLAGLLAAAVLGAAAAAAAAGTVTAEHVTVSLVAEHAHVTPGAPAAIGLHFDLEDHWHVYWRNPGDSGEAPTVEWTVPSGFAVAPLEWPVPERIVVGPLANYGYEGEVLLPAPLRVPEDARLGEIVTVGADVSWLVCRAEECVPGTATLVLRLPLDGEPAPASRWAPAFERARTMLPRSSARAVLRTTAGAGTLWLRISGVEASPDASIAFFPDAPGVIEAAAPQRARPTANGIEIELVRSATAAEVPATLGGVLRIDTGDETRVVGVDAATAAGGSLVVALALAAAGGLLLNLMPCVFPVLSLKVLSFVRQGDDAPRRVRAHGWAFTLGVVVSFWLLGGALIALRAGGEQLGWGFQLQSPATVAGLAALMLVLGLNLAGVFEVGLSLTTAGGAAASRSGLSGSFWTGALATVVATPCTAPFMGAALGWALTQPAGAAMAVFTALALGMAAPYLLLAHSPAALRLLPRPGAWMETLKTLLAFPLFGTVLWLVWVFHLQTGADAAFLLLGALLVLALGVRLWGESQARGGARVWRLAAVVVIAAALPMGASTLLPDPAAQRVATARDPFWTPWSPERERAARENGAPLFVNYTAAWCLTCQVNERLVFAASEVRDAFRHAGVTALKADWTDRDAEIARALERHGRSGVPLYVLYSGVPGAPPRILSQLPTRADVIEALGAAADPTKKEDPS